MFSFFNKEKKTNEIKVLQIKQGFLKGLAKGLTVDELFGQYPFVKEPEWKLNPAIVDSVCVWFSASINLDAITGRVQWKEYPIDFDFLRDKVRKKIPKWELVFLLMLENENDIKILKSGMKINHGQQEKTINIYGPKLVKLIQQILAREMLDQIPELYAQYWERSKNDATENTAVAPDAAPVSGGAPATTGSAPATPAANNPPPHK